MNSQTTFAVVDIETTGTDPKIENKIIQFSCYLVKDSQIIDNYNTYINPEQKIPNQIKQLTGITDEQLENAPTFDQVAAKIYQILQNAVFVAHNINFDFTFVNNEFTRIGYPELDNDGIDTVTLSQIMLPMLSSYRLQNLSNYFNILHDRPHLADSDALATAKLLIILLKQINHLPQITLDQIISVRPDLPKDTFKVFQSINRNRQMNNTNLKFPDHLKLVNGIVIRKKNLPIKKEIDQSKSKYPKTRKAKMNVLPNRLESRKEQNEMMNMIYNNFSYTEENHSAKNLLIEAPTGIGKSLGYVFPYSYLVQENKPLIISTSTTSLQNQLKYQTMPLLNEKLPFEITSCVLKGVNHYIDLSKFKNWLVIEDHSSYASLVKAQMLVWLTITKTGDLDELHINMDQATFIKKIQHDGKINPEILEDDFLNYNLEVAKRSHFIIINHAYLLNNRQKLNELGQKPYLVIDEANQFSDTAIKNNKIKLNPLELTTLINKITASIYQPIDNSIYYLKEYNLTINSLTNIVIKQVTELKKDTEQLINNLFKSFVQGKKLQRQGAFFQVLITPENVINFRNSNENIFTDIKNIGEVLKRLVSNFYKQIDQNISGLTNNDLSNMTIFLDYLEYLAQLVDRLLMILNSNDQVINQHVFWLSVNSPKDINSLNINYGLAVDNTFLRDEVYNYFEPVTFTSATLLSSKKSKFTFEALGIEPSETKVKRLENEFELDKNSKLYLVDDQKNSKVDSLEYLESVAKSIKMIFNAQKRQTLVLFNSLKAIEKVYEILADDEFFEETNVIAQGIHGSPGKVSKMFMNQKPSILLGTSSFWSGIDLPGDLLELLLIAQLPFDSPSDPYNHAIYSLERNKGHNPFYTITVPKATLRLRQGIGRLIRTRDDYGVAFLLDPRLLDHSYGKTITANLNRQLPIQESNLKNSIADMNIFFDDHKKDSLKGE